MDAKIIEMSEQNGFKRWTKGDYDRLYINDFELLGLFVDYYNTGNVCYAEFNGEKISNRQAKKMLNCAVYIDLNNDMIYTPEWFEDNAIELVKRITGRTLATKCTTIFQNY